MPCATRAPQARRDGARRGPAGSSAAACRGAHRLGASSVRWCGVTSTEAMSLWPSRKRDLLGGRDVQHMDAGAGLAGDARPAARSQRSAAISSRQTGCEDGSPVDAMRQRARAGAARPRNGRRRGGACLGRIARRPSSSATSRSPVEEPMKTLMPAAPGSRSSSPTWLGIVVGAADAEGEVAMHAALGARELVGERLRRRRSAGWCWASRRRR